MSSIPFVEKTGSALCGVEKTVYIMRGVPGCGKSTYVTQLSTSDSTCICSADNFFLFNGKYNFDPRKIGEAHQYCLSVFIDALITGISAIFVDNTNSTLWEYQNYLKLARCWGYRVRIIEIVCRNTGELQIFHARNKHNVPYEACLRMWRRWERDPNAELVADHPIVCVTNDEAEEVIEK